MEVVKMVDHDVAEKVDTHYIEEQLTYVSNVGILYICTSEGGEEDDWIDEESGMRYIVIHLPHKVVRRLQDVRPLMLARARERLGLTAGNSIN